MALTWDVETFEWDDANARKVLAHAITSDECEWIFLDQHKRIMEDIAHSEESNEPRHILIGETPERRKLFVVFTIRSKRIRVITARDMHRKELIRYYGEA